MSSITVRHDLRSRFGPARDQGGRETCLAFAMSDAHAAAIGAPWSPLCCEYLFWHAKQFDQSPVYQGTTVPAIRYALESVGQPIEADWPYLSALPQDLTTWQPPAQIGTLFRRKSQPTGSGFKEIWESVEADTPTLVGMTLSKAFFGPDEDGIIDTDEPPDPNIKHAILAVATGEHGKRKLVLARNSWGGTWGFSGCAWISERYMTPRVMVAIAVE